MSGNKRKVTMIGAGPAGIAAAQQCIREGIKDVLVLEKERIGGLICQANRIENFPGFVGKDGRRLAEELKGIVSKYDIDVEHREVKKIEKIEDGFRLETDKGSEVTEYLVLATGTAPRSLGFQGEVYHPEWRDHSGKKVVIVGGGDAAYDYALRINRLGGDVVILRRSGPKALPVLVKEAREKGIEEKMGEPEDIHKKEDGFVVRYDEKEVSADTVITAIGREPRFPDSDFYLDPEEVNFPTGETNIDDLFMIGSNVLGTYRQTSLCWGMGIAAGMKLSSMI
ncbi:MAG: NAD(P)/FAD-dependent oxidoreductase [Candidatus Natronoplasma sp.]